MFGKTDSSTSFPYREFVISNVPGGTIRFNPLVSLFAIVFLWGVTIWCMVVPETAKATLVAWRGDIAEHFTWFYIGTNPALMFFMIWVGIRYGSIRLGPQDALPEFSDASYFAMLFSSGIGVGLFFYGVSEPLWHQGYHWYANAGYHSEDEIDMFAMNLTVFHWGITGWSQYLVVAICMGLAGFKFGYPFSLRSCFYPLIGEYVYGWIGDVIDGFTIVTTVSGVCTSLGLGAFQIAAGLQRVGAVSQDLEQSEVETVQIISIWIITIVATLSVVSGLSIGIKYLSMLGFGLGMVLLTLVFLMEKTEFLLNLIVQEIGYYFQSSIFLLNFHTDAFAQLATGEGRATDGNAAAIWFMDAWTIFYIGWWVSWAAFVGMFIGRISKGRTIGSVMFYSYVCPLIYTIIWFGVFGGVGLRQARQAKELKGLGLSVFNDTNHFMNEDFSYCYDVPQESLYGADGSLVYKNTMLGITPVCEFNSGEADNAWFNVLYSFTYPLDFSEGLGTFMAWLSLFAVAIYFITSSDSGSLIVDNLASNGDEDTNVSQRVFWAFTEGAVATALLVSGGGDALRALQAGSILTGLPFTFILCFLCISIVKMCNLAEKNEKEGTEISLKEEYAQRKVFTIPVYGGVFNIFEYILSFGLEIPVERAEVIIFPTGVYWYNFVIAAFLPVVPFYKISTAVYAKSQVFNIVLTVVYGILFYVGIALLISIVDSVVFRAIAVTIMLMDACILSSLRGTYRAQNGIEGNMLADFGFSLFFYPQVLCQILFEVDLNEAKEYVE